MATKYLSKCYVEEETDERLVLRGKRLGGLVGALILLIWGVPLVALAWWGYGRGRLPLAAFLLAEGIGILAVLGALALLWNRVIGIKHRIIVDSIQKEVHLDLPLGKGPQTIPYDAVKTVDIDLVDKEDWSTSRRSSSQIFQLNLKAHDGGVYEIDRSTEFDEMTELQSKIRRYLGLPAARRVRPMRPATGTEEEPSHEGLGLSQWIDKLEDPESSTREKAALALGMMGSRAKKAVHALSKRLQDPDPGVRDSALASLGFIGPDIQTLPSLIEILVDEGQDKVSRRQAAIAIGRIGSRAKEGVSHLTRALESEDLHLRLAAAGALVRIDTGQAEKVLPMLIEALGDENKSIRGNAVTAIRDIGAQAAEAVPVLVKVLETDSRENRIMAASALGEIGTTAKAAVPALKRLLEDPDNILRNYAKSALGNIEGG